MKLSLKSKKAWLWSTDHSLEAIREKLADGKIDGDWLVCPLGEAERAVTVSQFIDRPSLFDREEAGGQTIAPAGESEDVMDHLPRITLGKVFGISWISMNFYGLS